MSIQKQTSRASRTARRAVPVSFADLGRIMGKSRSTISELMRTRLKAAKLSEGRVDLGHPDVRLYAKERGVKLSRHWSDFEPELPPLLVHEPSDTVQKLAVLGSCSVEEVRAATRPGGALAMAVVPAHHLAAEGLAYLAGVALAEVLDAAEGPLAPAILASGRIDLAHSAALEFMASHPFRRCADGLIVENDIPEGMLAPACVGDDVDLAHPYARAFTARCDGRVPDDSEAALRI